MSGYLQLSCSNLRLLRKCKSVQKLFSDFVLSLKPCSHGVELVSSIRVLRVAGS